MTPQDSNTYAWLDAQEVKPRNQNNFDNAKQEKRMLQKILDFLDMI